MIKFLHFADLHLGAPCKNIKDISKRSARREELFRSLSRLIRRTKEEDIKIVLCAGDLLSESISIKSAMRVAEMFGENSDIKFFISPGNHDFCDEKSPYNILQWPENVKIFKGGLERADAGSSGVSVFGCAFTKRFEDEPLIKETPALDKNRVNILLIHGDLGERSSRYNYISEEFIKTGGFDYVALGHIHQRSEISDLGGVKYAYPGSLEGHGFDEEGQKGFYIIETDKYAFKSEFVENSLRRYEKRELDISDFRSDLETKNEISLRFKDERESILRVTLSGEPDSYMPGCAAIENMLENEFFSISVLDGTRAVKNDLHLDQAGLKAVFEKNILKIIENSSGDEREIAFTAMRYGRLALAGEEGLDLD